MSFKVISRRWDTGAVPLFALSQYRTSLGEDDLSLRSFETPSPLKEAIKPPPYIFGAPLFRVSPNPC
jgi:hypothetical protein